MKILIIGGAGNIGFPVSKQLAEAGHHVVIVGRKATRSVHPEMHYIAGDTGDISFLRTLQQRHHFDVVINFAIQSTAQATANIEAFSHTVQQFIFISTVTVLDREKAVVLNEQSACGNPYSIYAQTKLACEALFLEAHQNAEFPVTIVRPSQTYSGDKFPLSIKGKSYWSVFDRILRNQPVIVHGDGTSTWVSMHSNDFAGFFLPLLGNSKAIGEIYHITSDEVLCWNMIYQAIGRQLNRDVRIVHVTTDDLIRSKKYDFKMSIQGDKQYSVLFDLSKIKAIVPDARCNISLEKGLSMYLEYMQQHPELKMTDPEFDTWCDRVIQQGEIA